MKISKKCCICDYRFTYDDRVYIDPLVAPHDAGAQYYYNLWHFFIEKCPQCGYASKDISKTDNDKIVKDEIYLTVADVPLIKTLNNARPNRIADYLYASVYYESVADNLNYAKCLLQASDLVFAEMMYWEEYVIDSSNSLSAIQNKAQMNEFQKFANGLYEKGVKILERYVEDYVNDIDSSILLAGTLCSGDKIQKIKGSKMLLKLKGQKLTTGQQLAVKFLIGSIN